MKATRNWGPCSCNCGETIVPESEFEMIGGAMYLKGHEGKATRQIPAVKKCEKAANKQ
ncbi:MAG: hypothetical protein GF398_09025 [Chitinivibrionales bacterium]|nr:hypothetical protein [Chitinivibrionales bacterium]